MLSELWRGTRGTYIHLGERNFHTGGQRLRHGNRVQAVVSSGGVRTSVSTLRKCQSLKASKRAECIWFPAARFQKLSINWGSEASYLRFTFHFITKCRSIEHPHSTSGCQCMKWKRVTLQIGGLPCSLSHIMPVSSHPLYGNQLYLTECKWSHWTCITINLWGSRARI